MVHKTIVPDSEIISIDGKVRLIKCPDDGFRKFWLMSIRVMESQNTFYWNSLFSQFTNIFVIEIWFKDVMIVRKIGIANVQLVKGNFATHKLYHLKHSTRRFIIFNFQLVKSSWQLLKYQFSTHSFQKDFSTQKAHLVTDKIISLNLKLIKSKSELTKSNLQLVILFSICNADLQLVKLLSKS